MVSHCQCKSINDFFRGQAGPAASNLMCESSHCDEPIPPYTRRRVSQSVIFTMDEALEADLACAFYALQSKFGQTAAIQAMGRILSSIGSSEPPHPHAKPTMHIDIPKSGRSSVDKGSLPASPFQAASVSPRDRDSSGRKDRDVKLFSMPATNQVSDNWKKAVKAALRSEDPWADRGIHLLKMELANRIRFDPSTRDWVMDPVIVRMEEKPFAAGALN